MDAFRALRKSEAAKRTRRTISITPVGITAPRKGGYLRTVRKPPPSKVPYGSKLRREQARHCEAELP